jgi:hypothetical protein
MTIRQIPIIAPTQLPAAVTNLVTVPANTTYRVGRAGFSNPTAGALTITMYVVPAGGTPTTANQVIDTVTVPANSTYISPELAGLVIPAGASLQGFASAANAIVVYASGVSIQ